ncbi:MAG: ligase-associated DNA damage response endonuclease PdeM [bacterium]|nr:ligase-associated DNA damage response endonuclease PdeM [bacterium]
MLNNSIEIILNGEELILLPQKAIYIKSESSLLLSDIHLGKTGHFRNAGIALPPGLAYADFEILDELLFESDLKIKKIIVLGDMFHAERNVDWLIFEEWRNLRSEIHIQLIKGNHDKLSNFHYESLGIEVFDSAVLNKFLLVHNYKDAESTEGLYKICGHIHPAVRIHGKGRQGLTLPCFYFGAEFGILPAFGSFTGKHIIRPEEKDIVFVIAGKGHEKKVLQVS